MADNTIFQDHLEASIKNLTEVTQGPKSSSGDIPALIAQTKLTREITDSKLTKELGKLPDVDEFVLAPTSTEPSIASTAQQVDKEVEGGEDAPRGYMGLDESRFIGGTYEISTAPQLSDYGPKKAPSGEVTGAAHRVFPGSRVGSGDASGGGYSLRSTRGTGSAIASGMTLDTHLLTSIDSLEPEVLDELQGFLDDRSFDPSTNKPSKPTHSDPASDQEYQAQLKAFDKAVARHNEALKDPEIDTDALIPYYLLRPMICDLLAGQQYLRDLVTDLDDRNDLLKRELGAIKGSITELTRAFYGLRTNITETLSHMKDQRVVTVRNATHAQSGAPSTEWVRAEQDLKGKHTRTLTDLSKVLATTPIGAFGMPSPNLTGERIKAIREVNASSLPADSKKHAIAELRSISDSATMTSFMTSLLSPNP